MARSGPVSPPADGGSRTAAGEPAADPTRTLAEQRRTIEEQCCTMDEQRRTIEEQGRTIDEQRRTIAALIQAAERRTADEPDSSAIATWRRNLTLQRRVAERTHRVRAAEQLLRSVIDSMDAGLCILAADGTIIDTNTSWQRMLGAGGYHGGSFFALGRQGAAGVGELLAEAAESVRDVLAGRKPEAGAEVGVLVRGEQRWWKADVDRVRGHDAGQAMVTLTDVTRQVRTREKLRQTTRDASRLALVAQHMDDAVVITSVDGVIEWVNEAFTRMSGFSAAEATGRTRVSLLGGVGPQPALDEFRSPDGQFMLPEILTKTKDGRPYWLKTELFKVTDDGVVRLVGVERDVTARREAERTLLAAIEHSEALARELAIEQAVLTGVISAIPHLTYWKDSHGRYQGHNAAYRAMRGVSPDVSLLGRAEQDLSFRDDLSDVLLDVEQQVLLSGQAVIDKQITVACADGYTRTVLMSVLPQPDAAGLIGVGVDVTRISLLERQLNQHNRLEAIGQLAAGVAHEINTPIQFASDNTRFVAESFTQLLALIRGLTRSCEPAAIDDPARAVSELRDLLIDIDVGFLLDEIPAALAESLEGLDRVAQIVRAMKDFSHPGQGRRAVDVNRAVESTVHVARNEWRYLAELDLELGADVGLVPCYEGEFKQVVLNLIVNAAHAIEARQPREEGRLGLIRVTTSRLRDGVKVTVSDDGSGMDTATQQRMFDPFFTTKEVGKGTGQGLSMAYASIVQKHGGSIRVDSTPGAGTTFTLCLPIDAEARLPTADEPGSP